MVLRRVPARSEVHTGWQAPPATRTGRQVVRVVLPATANVDQPTVKKESIEEMRRNLPEQVFRQEVAAMFLNDSAGVFQYIRECIMAGPLTEAPLPGRRYVMGIDLARVEDFTVITVEDTVRKHIVHQARFNEIGWQIQYYRIIEISQLYNNAYFMLDSTGLGDPIYDALINAGLNGEPYKLSNQSKQALMEKLRINIEHRRITFPQLDIMIDELERYQYEITESGLVRYGAPDGFHDDTVISLALANWAADVPPFVYRARNVRGI
jgi:phage FluMu gp28-like protein